MMHKLLISLNHIQRVVLAVAFMAIVVIIFLHNPVSGYTTQSVLYIGENGFSAQCSEEEVGELIRTRMVGNSSSELEIERLSNPNFKILPDGIEKWPKKTQFDYLEKLRQRANYLDAKCSVQTMQERIQEIPFESWSSNRPIADWFGSIQNIFSLIVAIILALAFILYLFQSRPPPPSQ